MKKNKLLLLMAAFAVMLTVSCTKDEPDDPVIPNEEEVITTLIFTLTPTDGGAPVVLFFQDLDGDGGEAPTITNGILDSASTYNGSLQLLNELDEPAEDITEEVQEESDEHQFFFQTTVDGLNVAYNDMDDNGNPIGLSTIITTSAASNGTLTVILRHEPDKTATGVSDGDITNAGGETDIQITFNVEVE